MLDIFLLFFFSFFLWKFFFLRGTAVALFSSGSSWVLNLFLGCKTLVVAVVQMRRGDLCFESLMWMRSGDLSGSYLGWSGTNCGAVVPW